MIRYKLLSITCALLLLFACGEKPKSPEQLRQELLFNELAEAKRYVTIDNALLTKDSHLFKADEVVITGTVKSSATVAKFKDVQYQVLFYSKTNTQIDQRNFVIYEYLPPGGELKINARMVPPNGYSTFSVKITDVNPG